MDIKSYLNDGANWQAQAVLACLRSMKEYILEEVNKEHTYGFENEIRVGRYENAREQGYVFSIRCGIKQRNYAVYEHRNSDSLIVLISNTKTMNTPNVEEMWRDKGENASKYDYDKGFEYGEILECANYIAEDMRKFFAKEDENRSKENNKEES